MSEHRSLGLSYLSAGKWEEALQAFYMACSVDPTSYITYLDQAKALIGLVRIEDAIVALKKCLELNPNIVYAYYTLGHLLDHLGRPEEGIMFIDKILKEYPGNPVVLFQKGEILMKQGKHREALESLKVAQASNYSSAPMYYSIGVCYSTIDDETKAKEYFTNGVNTVEKTSFGFVARGRCFSALDRKEEAMGAFQKAKELLETDNTVILLPGHLEVVKKVLKTVLEVEDESNKASELITQIEQKELNIHEDQAIISIRQLQKEKNEIQNKAIQKMSKMKPNQEVEELNDLGKLKGELEKQIAILGKKIAELEANHERHEKRMDNIERNLDKMKDELNNKMNDYQKTLESELSKQGLPDADQLKLKAYWKAYLETFNSAFVTAQVIDCDQVLINSNSSTATVLSLMASFAPFVGDLLSKGIQQIGDFMKSRQMKENARKMKRLAADGVGLSQIVGKTGYQILTDKKKQLQVIEVTPQQMREASKGLLQNIKVFCEQLEQKIDTALYTDLYPTAAARLGHNDANKLIKIWMEGNGDSLGIEEEFVEAILNPKPKESTKETGMAENEKRTSSCCNMF